MVIETPFPVTPSFHASCTFMSSRSPRFRYHIWGNLFEKERERGIQSQNTDWKRKSTCARGKHLESLLGFPLRHTRTNLKDFPPFSSFRVI